MVGERCITGKILKPYFQAGFRRILEPSLAERLIRHINALYLELEWKVPHLPPVPLQSEAFEEPGHAEREPQLTRNQRGGHLSAISPRHPFSAG